ncbi:his operon leader peptide [Cronobacter sakazakii]|nr:MULTISPECIES: his operon leader peptide [Cronobacter]EGT4310666.1 his operon leader peptide [Cronobacter sakazakii]EGT4368735.1 his operon leader peptide [Cronobacter sakazakii]EIZ8957938.1 his operon leader peptide [Cronobacter sakazakii]EKK4016431.1 his operon leader peptide [Cronobacter sakazakii]EKM1391908.1 his operon leader peptide [Cronobacter sakazakii]
MTRVQFNNHHHHPD